MNLLQPILLIILNCLIINGFEINLENLNFKLKWLTRNTKLPLTIEKHLDANSNLYDADFKWYKYPEKQFINEVENYEQIYKYKQTSSKVELSIQRYDRNTHEQLSSYIALPVAFRSHSSADAAAAASESTNFQNDLFTIAFLDKQEIEFGESETDPSMIDFYCNVSILIPYNELELNKINIELVQQNLDLKMGLLDAEKMKLHSRSQSGKIY